MLHCRNRDRSDIVCASTIKTFFSGSLHVNIQLGIQSDGTEAMAQRRWLGLGAANRTNVILCCHRGIAVAVKWPLLRRCSLTAGLELVTKLTLLSLGRGSVLNEPHWYCAFAVLLNTVLSRARYLYQATCVVLNQVRFFG